MVQGPHSSKQAAIGCRVYNNIKAPGEGHLTHNIAEQWHAIYCSPFHLQVDAFGIAPALDVEHAMVTPAMLVVSDERSAGVGGQGRLSGSREAEEQRDVAVLADVATRVQRQDALMMMVNVFMGGRVMHCMHDKG